MANGLASVTVSMASGLRELIVKEAMEKNISLSEVVTTRLALSFRKAEFAVIKRRQPGRKPKEVET